MLSSSQGSKPFNKWAVDIQSLNTLLRGTTLHLSETNLHYHLEAHMHPELANKYHVEKVSTTVGFWLWIEKIHLLDEKHLRQLVKQKEAVEATIHAECFRNGRDKKLSLLTQYNARSGASRKTGSFVRVPPLTEEEWRLLRDNNGCFKCREPFAGHTSNVCSKEFPDGASYKTVTAT
ncbi:uncharacterized protein HD556DRAFT_1222355, partial [Suillus plorans]